MSLGNDPFEVDVLDGVVVRHHHREAFLDGIHRRTLGNRPGFEDTTDLKSKVVVQPGRPVLVNDETAVLG